MVMEQSGGRSKVVREALARVDMTKEFPLHDYMVFADNGDGTITVSVPWSEFTHTTEGDRQDAKRAFGRAYVKFITNNTEEQTVMGRFMDERGYLPLSKRN